MKWTKGWTALLGGLLCAGCVSDLGIPFQRNGGRVSLFVADSGTDYTFISNHTMYGIEWSEDEQGTKGWGYEGSIRFGSAEGGGSDLVRNPFNFNKLETVKVQRESDFREFCFGVRQTYCPDSSLKPYFGVGGAMQRVRSFDRLQFSNPVDPDQPIPHQVHFQGNSPALYAHTGLQWSFLRDRLGRGTEFILAIDARGLIGQDYDSADLGIVLGFGK